MFLKNLIAMVATTVAIAGSFANASAAEFAVNNRAQILEKSGKKDSISNKVTQKTTDITAKAGAGNASAAPSQPSKTNENTGAGNASAAPSQPTKTNENTGAGNAPATPSQPTKTNENTGAGNAAAAPSQPTDPNANPAGNGGDGSSATNGGTEYGETYSHNTSIYKDDGSLWRVEYYDDNNRLYEYSDVDGYDKDTHSYTETVYRYDEENDVEIPVRTDTYVNGELVSSVYY